MPKTVSEWIADVIRREGGYVNHPADKGGATKYGITEKTLTGWRQRPVSIDEVKALGEEEAREIYRALYFSRPKLARLPEFIQAQTFDISVNSGPRRAIMLLQQALNRQGFGPLSEDGLIGPQTIGAAYAAQTAEKGSAVNNALVDVRLAFYRGLVLADPTQEVFLKGWLKRAEEFREVEHA